MKIKKGSLIAFGVATVAAITGVVIGCKGKSKNYAAIEAAEDDDITDEDLDLDDDVEDPEE